MAETVHLYLKANGNDVQGESSQKSLGRENSIECTSYHHGVDTPRDETNAVTGRRMYTPVRISKRMDKSSPLLMKALTENQKIDAVFKFFRPNPAGDGTTEQFYTVKLKEGNVSSVHQNVSCGSQSADAPLEDIEFVFKEITWTYMKGGVEHTDSWSGNK